MQSCIAVLANFGIASRRGALRRLASYCELGLTVREREHQRSTHIYCGYMYMTAMGQSTLVYLIFMFKVYMLHNSYSITVIGCS